MVGSGDIDQQRLNAASGAHCQNRTTPMKRFIFAAFLALVLPLGSKAAEPSSRPDWAGREHAVTLFTSQFLRSFENLDLDAFMACFAPDATVFFPSPETPKRFDGQAAIRENFAKVFSAIRQASKATAPPYHRLPPERLSLKVLSAESAVVSFELVNEDRIARRTLVLTATPNGWLIEHLHASNVPVQR